MLKRFFDYFRNPNDRLVDAVIGMQLVILFLVHLYSNLISHSFFLERLGIEFVAIAIFLIAPFLIPIITVLGIQSVKHLWRFSLVFLLLASTHGIIWYFSDLLGIWGGWDSEKRLNTFTYVGFDGPGTWLVNSWALACYTFTTLTIFAFVKLLDWIGLSIVRKSATKEPRRKRPYKILIWAIAFLLIIVMVRAAVYAGEFITAYNIAQRIENSSFIFLCVACTLILSVLSIPAWLILRLKPSSKKYISVSVLIVGTFCGLILLASGGESDALPVVVLGSILFWTIYLLITWSLTNKAFHVDSARKISIENVGSQQNQSDNLRLPTLWSYLWIGLFFGFMVFLSNFDPLVLFNPTLGPNRGQESLLVRKLQKSPGVHSGISLDYSSRRPGAKLVSIVSRFDDGADGEEFFRTLANQSLGINLSLDSPTPDIRLDLLAPGQLELVYVANGKLTPAQVAKLMTSPLYAQFSNVEFEEGQATFPPGGSTRLYLTQMKKGEIAKLFRSGKISSQVQVSMSRLNIDDLQAIAENATGPCTVYIEDEDFSEVRDQLVELPKSQMAIYFKNSLSFGGASTGQNAGMQSNEAKRTEQAWYLLLKTKVRIYVDGASSGVSKNAPFWEAVFANENGSNLSIYRGADTWLDHENAKPDYLSKINWVYQTNDEAQPTKVFCPWISNGSLKLISQLSSLESLSFDANWLSPPVQDVVLQDNTFKLDDFGNLTELRELDLGMIICEDFRFLQKLTKLESLTFYEPGRVVAKGLPVFPFLNSYAPQLKQITVYEPSISTIKELAKHTNLEMITIATENVEYYDMTSPTSPTSLREQFKSLLGNKMNFVEGRKTVIPEDFKAHKKMIREKAMKKYLK